MNDLMPGIVELLPARAEVWPVAADEVCIWLVSGGETWQSGLIARDDEPHEVVRRTVDAGLDPHPASGTPAARVALLHQTSSRVDHDEAGNVLVLTYVAVLDGPGEYVRDVWPAAWPLGVELASRVGKPIPHEAAEPPTPRYIDVLLHSIRHLAFLRDTDATAREALGANCWRTWRSWNRRWPGCIGGDGWRSRPWQARV